MSTWETHWQQGIICVICWDCMTVCNWDFCHEPEWLACQNLHFPASLGTSWEVQLCLLWLFGLWDIFPCILAQASFCMYKEKLEYKQCDDSCKLCQKFYIFFYYTMCMHLHMEVHIVSLQSFRCTIITNQNIKIYFKNKQTKHKITTLVGHTSTVITLKES